MMKRITLLSLLLVAATLALRAQHVVTGTVVDRDGNPIPGAKVEIVGSTESTITELDGTFSLTTQKADARKVRVQYGGMLARTKKIEPGMVVKLRESSWWTEKPERMAWFAGVQIGLPDSEDIVPAYGLMVGQVKQWGWYVRGFYSKMPDTHGIIIRDEHGWFTGKTDQGYWSVTAGGMVRLWSPFHFYAGLGYSKRTVAWQRADGSYAKYDDDSYYGMALDLGFMLKVKRIFVNAGLTMNDMCDPSQCVGTFGVGYFF